MDWRFRCMSFKFPILLPEYKPHLQIQNLKFVFEISDLDLRFIHEIRVVGISNHGTDILVSHIKNHMEMSNCSSHALNYAANVFVIWPFNNSTTSEIQLFRHLSILLNVHLEMAPTLWIGRHNQGISTFIHESHLFVISC